ncbi:MAG TPA: DNA repair protein RadC [Desulfatirhabdiaceae bacterium]|nr:DNA repair protein RadC [Desulfatirhabdiaceae bacterium]
MREKFMESGLIAFRDDEVIELLLTLGTPRKDCKNVARDLMKQFKTFHHVLEAPVDELMNVSGIGPQNVFGIRLIRAVAERYLEKRLMNSVLIHNARELFDYLYMNMRDKTRESFLVIYLDAKNRIIELETLFEGTLTSTSIYPREVVTAALRHHAAAVIFAHNHPSGDPTPSPEDYAVTRQLIAACRIVSITVHEHIVIGNNRYFSFADQGYIARAYQDCDRDMEAT